MSRLVTPGQRLAGRFAGNSARISPRLLAAGAMSPASPSCALAKVEDFGHIDLAGHNASLQDARGESTGVVEFVIDEVAVSLDHDAAARMSEVENLVGASRTPPSAGALALLRSMASSTSS
jgi:hypothetical protein